MSLTISDEMLNSVGLSDQELLIEIAVMLFRQNRISLGKASKMAKMNSVEFQELLAKRNISMHYDIEEFEEDEKTIKNLPEFQETSSENMVSEDPLLGFIGQGSHGFLTHNIDEELYGK